MCITNSIDRLPDEMLIAIVSCLPMEDAVRTSVLSHRWRYFWKCSSVLDFDGSLVRYKSNYLNATIESRRITFADWVDRVLESHIGKIIDKIRIWFDFDLTNSNDIDRWFKFAFTKRVKRLELRLGMCGAHKLDRSYVFPNIFDPIERLRIFPIGEGLSSCCESLVTLSLSYVEINGEVLELFISNCPLLEELRVEFASSLRSLITSRPLKRLRRLVITQCTFLSVLKVSSPNLLSYLEISCCPLLDILEICSPNLLKFPLVGEKVSSESLKNVPSIVDLCLKAEEPEGVLHTLAQVSRWLSRLENLEFHVSKLKVRDPLPSFQKLPRLKKLLLRVKVYEHGHLLCFAPLLDAAPMLRELKVFLAHRHYNALPRELGYTIEGHTHECLEVLQIMCFTGAIDEVEFVEYVIKHAVSLKKVVIYIMPVPRGTKGKGKEAVRLLKSKLSQGVELIVGN